VCPSTSASSPRARGNKLKITPTLTPPPPPSPRVLSCPGHNLANVFALRTAADAARIAAAVGGGGPVVVVGTSFVGMELAATIAGGGSSKVWQGVLNCVTPPP
jgi:NADPH-dependent 2,4-dienoyl-CoA reductase/sulfur reductase-like enzyme